MKKLLVTATLGLTLLSNFAWAHINKNAVNTFLSQGNLLREAVYNYPTVINVLRYRALPQTKGLHQLTLGTTDFSMASTFNRGFVATIERDARSTFVDGPLIHTLLSFDPKPKEGFHIQEDLQDTKVLLEAFLKKNVYANLSKLLKYHLLRAEHSSTVGTHSFTLSFGTPMSMAQGERVKAVLHVSVDLRQTLVDGPAHYYSRISWIK